MLYIQGVGRDGPLRWGAVHLHREFCCGVTHAASAADDAIGQSGVTRKRKALPTTLTDDSAMAAAAMIGDSKMPKVG